MSAPCWHVVRAIGRSDEQVTRSLVNAGFPTYSPKILEMRRLGKRQMSAAQRRAGIAISRPQLVSAFAPYLFVRLDMGRHGWREIFSVVGVGGLICEGGLPVPVSQAVIERIKDIETQGAIVARETRMRTVFKVGQHVQVNSGPFTEFHGMMQSALDLPFDQVDADVRVRVALSLFGGAVVAEIPAWQVA